MLNLLTHENTESKSIGFGTIGDSRQVVMSQLTRGIFPIAKPGHSD